LYYGKVERSDVGRSSVARSHSKDTKDIPERSVSNLTKYFNRSPKELGEAELKEYMPAGGKFYCC
jgi:hypothetical protein